MTNEFTTRSCCSASDSPNPPSRSNWEKLEYIKPFYHEAAHAVVALVTGFRVEWVSMDQVFIDADPIAIENDSTGRGPVCMTISSDRLAPILHRGSIRTWAERTFWLVRRRSLTLTQTASIVAQAGATTGKSTARFILSRATVLLGSCCSNPQHVSSMWS